MGDLSFWLRQCGVSQHLFAAGRPDFLIISPPRTGSTWLAENLRAHSRLFLPRSKELKFFSSGLHSLPLAWYFTQFLPGEGRRKGESSPSYAILPPTRIELIRRLFPDLKLIYLMREPIARAWSHAKHNLRHHEVNFAEVRLPPEAVTPQKWRENFAHPWTLASGDYLGQLRRWTAVFPSKNLYLGFYEDIAERPEALLREILRFLGVDWELPLNTFPLQEKIHMGPEGALPLALEDELHGMWHGRTTELSAYLAAEFGRALPPCWNRTMAARDTALTSARAKEVCEHAFDDAWLAQVVAWEETFESATRIVFANHEGYDIYAHQGRFVAVGSAAGAAALYQRDPTAWQAHVADGTCFVADTLAEARLCVDRHLLAQARRLRSELDALRQTVADMEQRLREEMRQHHSLLARLRRIWRALVGRFA